jgi:poly-gamma-glutamate capsule biosynthesis protein CapA/YwtB (metallophosphatase superfamily)
VAAAVAQEVRVKRTIKRQAAKVVVLLAKQEQAPHLPEPVVAAVRKLQAVTAALLGVAANLELQEVLLKAVTVASLLLQLAAAAAAAILAAAAAAATTAVQVPMAAAAAVAVQASIQREEHAPKDSKQAMVKLSLLT